MHINVIKKVYITAFTILLVFPLVFFNFKGNGISENEKRLLADIPKIYTEEGNLNNEYTSQFEEWINDNIGFRSVLNMLNGKMLYYCFDTIGGNSDQYLGPHVELDYITPSILRSYQHLDLKSDEEMREIVNSYQKFSDYLEENGIQYYYYQCWDKQSIYPEHFPNGIIQYNDYSKTDQIVRYLAENTSINVISPKQALIDAKDDYDTYSTWGDPTHWTQRGAYIGYQELMKAINTKNDNKYKVLSEEDYDIKAVDQGCTIYGDIHNECMLETFEIRNPRAYKTGEAPIYVSTFGSNHKNILQNDSVDNEDTILIIGDSYFDGFIYDDIAESFHKVVMVWGGNVANIKELVEEYHPSIVIEENAERCDRTADMVEASKELK